MAGIGIFGSRQLNHHRPLNFAPHIGSGLNRTDFQQAVSGGKGKLSADFAKGNAIDRRDIRGFGFSNQYRGFDSADDFENGFGFSANLDGGFEFEGSQILG